MFTNQNIYLKDTYLNVVHDLKQSNYNFVSDSGIFDNRFVLQYQNGTLSNTNFTVANSIVLYKNQSGEIIINSGNFIMDELSVIDLLGRVVYKKSNINASETKIKLETNQVLLFQIKTNEGLKVVKKYVN